MRAGVSVAEFWDLTPFETLLVIEANIWRDEHDQKMLLKHAWDIAALSRSKRLPKLSLLLKSKPVKRLKGQELIMRRSEFQDMTKNIDLKKLNDLKRRK